MTSRNRLLNYLMTFFKKIWKRIKLMFGGMRDKLVSLALSRMKGRYMDANLEGIGTIKDIAYRQGQLVLTVVLEGLEDRPLTIGASEVEIAPDGSSIKVGKFDSNMAFANNALNRFAVREFPIPEGSARTALKMARTVLGL